jgi:hypothetical protein
MRRKRGEERKGRGIVREKKKYSEKERETESGRKR